MVSTSPGSLLRVCLPHTAPKGVVGHDREQVAKFAAELSASQQELPLFLFGHPDPLRHAGSEDSILCFHVGYLPGEFLLGDRGEYDKQWMQKSHGATPEDREKCRLLRGGQTFETTLEGDQNST